MIKLTPYTVTQNVLKQAQDNLPDIGNDDKKLSVVINKPTGNFFYDPWEIKDEFRNTVWETVLNTLPGSIGEARLIQLQHGTCYMSHCDIDDRYHLNIEGQYSFLIDIDSQQMFPTIADGSWYTINTGIRHVAANFGSVKRIQLVVRQLLNDVSLEDPVSVKVLPICVNPRFEFDDIISPWLHKMNKELRLSHFEVLDDGVKFKLDKNSIKDLDSFPANKFKIILE